MALIRPKVLICGFGKMGHIHAKYLIKHDVNWHWYDPYLNRQETNRFTGDISNLDSLDFTHVIIATPEGRHYETYLEVKSGFSGVFLIEKPVVLDRENIGIFDDPNIYSGMVERFNPTIIALKDRMDVDNVVNIDFTRCSAAPLVSRANIFEDIGIHDLDLYAHLIGKVSGNFKLNISSRTYCLHIKNENNIARFIWSKETFFKERKIIVRQKDCTYEGDLQEQTLKRHYLDSQGRNIVEYIYVEKSSPIENELMNFLKNGDSVNAKKSHELMFNILDTLEEDSHA